MMPDENKGILGDVERVIMHDFTEEEWAAVRNLLVSHAMSEREHAHLILERLDYLLEDWDMDDFNADRRKD